jgi:hypothetical protein
MESSNGINMCRRNVISELVDALAAAATAAATAAAAAAATRYQITAAATCSFRSWPPNSTHQPFLM